jgi:hypothetical protein
MDDAFGFCDKTASKLLIQLIEFEKTIAEMHSVQTPDDVPVREVPMRYVCLR